ncbi:hypothetical protein ACEN9X_16280 [Mucilaginibacter sp. Mucisp86]|uniref:hypothetical protein n=1 Tax=Mucilaginibacter sp. Mucisp86 TaxID=3243060 RepID=UPI0039B4CF1A
MFEKLFLLVKDNAGTAVINNPVIPAKHHDAVINEASSSIIEVLKGQLESGKVKELIKYFQFSGKYNNSLVSSITYSFASKLNIFYSIDPAHALAVAKALIPAVMNELVKETKSGEAKEFALGTMLTKLNGNRTDLNPLVNNLMVA